MNDFEFASGKGETIPARKIDRPRHDEEEKFYVTFEKSNVVQWRTI